MASVSRTGICGVRVAVGDSSVAEGRRWCKPWPGFSKLTPSLVNVSLKFQM